LVTVRRPVEEKGILFRRGRERLASEKRAEATKREHA